MCWNCACGNVFLSVSSVALSMIQDGEAGNFLFKQLLEIYIRVLSVALVFLPYWQIVPKINGCM